ncbi:MAG TPA: carbohydrate kinase family protein [Terriglobales bacterium]|nr:carbohydrate kinase family protein [Terriglobales bacterium]
MPQFDVTVAGELNLDLILYGLPEELPPERELIADRMMLTLGASSAIVAHNLSALGSRVGFVSKIGDDALGEIALDRLKAGGVDVSRLQRISAGLKTGLTVVLQREKWRNMVTYAGTIFDLKYEDLDLEYLCSARHFHLSSYYLQRGLRPSVGKLFRKLKAAGLTISLDTNDDPDDLWQDDLHDVLQFVDVFLPNEREIRRVARTDDLEKAISQLADMVSIVVVKMGPAGAMAQRGKQRVVCPPVKVDPVDAVGAGDSFDSGFVHEFVRGADLATCLASGNRAGALSTTRPGGTEAFRDREYREAFLHQHSR